MIENVLDDGYEKNASTRTLAWSIVVTADAAATEVEARSHRVNAMQAVIPTTLRWTSTPEDVLIIQ
jgi:hypothetical protein